MLSLPAILMLAAVCISAYFLTRMTASRGRVAFLLRFATVLSAIIVLLGYLASDVIQLNHPAWWLAASCCTAGLITLPMLVNRRLRSQCLQPIGNLRDLVRRLRLVEFRRRENVLLLLLVVTVALIALGNLIIITSFEPATLDSLEYHLARMAYYLQQGSLRFFDADMWALTVHPKVATILMIFCHHLFGGNEKAPQWPQYLSYVVSLAAVYGISCRLGASRRPALFAACIFGLLTISIMEAATAQNDFILTAFIGMTLFFLLAYRKSRDVVDLFYAALAFALALGVKSVALTALPPLLLVVWLFFERKGKKTPSIRGHAVRALAGLALALAFITLPAGYLDNLRYFGDMLGPEVVKQRHTFADTPTGEMLAGGMLNVLRYSTDAFSIEGFFPVPPIRAFQAGLHAIPRGIFSACGIDLESTTGAILPFYYDTPEMANTLPSENYSNFGIFGFALLWPVVFWVLICRTYPRALRLLALGAVLYVVIHAFSGPYDVWHNRFFLVGALFSTPLLAFVAFRPRLVLARYYVSVIIMLGCFSALCAVSVRSSTFLYSFKLLGMEVYSSFISDPNPEIVRLAHLTRQDRKLFEGLYRFETHVPRNAVVAVDFGLPMQEYIYFGPHLTRTLIPIRPFDKPRKPVPANADFLLYAEDSPLAQPGDLLLYRYRYLDIDGAVYLRKLH